MSRHRFTWATAPAPKARLTTTLLATAVLLSACYPDNGSSSANNAGDTQNDETVVDSGPPTLSFIAGSSGGAGNTGGAIEQARFSDPRAMAVDGNGNVYVADNYSIRKITPDGVVSTLAGSGQRGSADGTGSQASFDYDLKLAVDAAGNVYVADYENKTIRKVTPQGVVTTLAGVVGARSVIDGTGGDAYFHSPRGIVVAPDGNIYVHDVGTLRQVTPQGVVTTVLGSRDDNRAVDGTGADVRLTSYAQAMAVDADGNIFMLEPGVVRKVTPDGEVTTIAGAANIHDHVDGTGTAARFTNSKGMTIDADGNLYVVDGDHTIRKVTPGGVVTTLAGQAGTTGANNGTGSAATFNFPEGIVAKANGDLLVGDSNNAAIRKVTPAGVVSTYAGSPGSWGAADGIGAAAQFRGPYGIAANATGLMYVADTYNHGLRVVTASGTVSTYSGALGEDESGFADGPLAQARFSYPYMLKLDGSNTLWLLDQGGSALRRISPQGVVSTLVSPQSDSFSGACGLTLDNDGNAYVGSSESNTVLKVTPAGVVSTLAGSSGGGASLESSAPVRAASVRPASATRSDFADGTGSEAAFNEPCGLAADASGNVYVADSGNQAIRKVTPAGVVTTIAGNPGTQGHADGTGSAATFQSPASMAISRSGILYVADGSTIRKVTTAGVVTTVAGVQGLFGFQAGALPGVLGQEITLSITGNTLYLTTGNAVAKISPLP
jgi:sugar lactone lactonase YvrE